jgi:hypothetical protein
MNRFTLFVVAGLVAGLTGCASSARFVEHNAGGGTVAVPDAAHRDDALSLIEHQVGQGYMIVEEREVPTGEVITRSTQEQGSGNIFARAFAWLTGHRQTQSSETTTVRPTEYQITYQKVVMPGQQPGVVQTQYISPTMLPPATPTAPPAPPPAVTPGGFQSRLSNFDTGNTCKL